MNKAIKILAIISLALAILGILLSVAVITFWWKPMSGLFVSPSSGLDVSPIPSVGDVLYMFGSLVIVIILCATPNQKGVIVPEIIFIVLLTMVYPVLTWYLNFIQQTYLAMSLGVNYLASFSTTSHILSFPGALVKLASLCSLVICGMRIVYKVYCKKQSI